MLLPKSACRCRVGPSPVVAGVLRDEPPTQSAHHIPYRYRAPFGACSPFATLRPRRSSRHHQPQRTAPPRINRGPAADQRGQCPSWWCGGSARPSCTFRMLRARRLALDRLQCCGPVQLSEAVLPSRTASPHRKTWTTSSGPLTEPHAAAWPAIRRPNSSACAHLKQRRHIVRHRVSPCDRAKSIGHDRSAGKQNRPAGIKKIPALTPRMTRA